nr:TonB-dependent receptor [uncultured Brevundimonas sp.]
MIFHHSFSSRGALCAGVATAALIAGGTAQAQDAAQEAAEVDEIVVTASPIVGSQRAALRQQRNADNLINVIAADTVGQFPDQNSAAALARLPAVAVQRDQGQERYLQVRGGPNRWTSVSIDGVNIIGVDEGGEGRAFRFDAVPAVILSALEVNKSLTPDLPAEAVLARVNLNTFSPFQQRGFHAFADLGYGEMKLGGGAQEQAAARASWSGDRFGIVAAASHYEREQTTDNREFDYDAAGLPTQFDFRSYQVTRSSDAAMLGLAFRPAEGHKLFFNSLYSDFNDEEKRNQYVFLLGGARRTLSRTSESGDLVGVGVRGMFNRGEYENSNWINTLGGDHRIGGWDVDWRINYTETENTTFLPIVLQNQTSNTDRVSLTYDAKDRNFPILNLYDTVVDGAGVLQRGAARTSLNQGAFGMNLLLPIVGKIETESWVYKLDGRRSFFLAGRDVELSAGLSYDSRSIKGSSLVQGSLINVTSAIKAADYVTDDLWDSRFPRGFDVRKVDNDRMRDDIDRVLAAAAFDRQAIVKPTDRYDIDEDVIAGYAMAKFRLGLAQIVAGLRIEQASQDIAGFVDTTPATGGDRVYSSLTASQDDTSVFPSINAKFDLTDDIVLRLSAQTGISRPSFAVVRTSASIDDTNTTVKAGNPWLEPERTWGGDASLEWYLPGAGLASVSGFYRNVENVLFNSTTKVRDNRYNAPGIDRSNYDYVTTLNGGEGKLYGVEVSYQQQFVFLPGAWEGLGFQGNLAMLAGDFEAPGGRTVDFPGVSDTIANASLFYEKYGISARVSWQWRSDWIDTLDFGGWGDQTRAAYESVDVSLRYAINDRVSLYLDANNLTDEQYIAFEGDKDHPTEVEQIGRRMMAGLRLRF